MTYEDYVGLLFNKHRVRLQQAAAVLSGMAACGNQALDEAWGDALADDPAEAAEIVYEANRERSIARSRAKAGPFE